MNALIILFGVIILLPLAILMVPFSFQVQGCLADKAAGEGKLAWAGGLLAVRFVFANSKPDFFVRFVIWEKRLPKEANQSEQKKAKRTRKTNRTKKTNKQINFGQVVTFLNTSLIKEVCRFLIRFQRSLNLRLEGEYGTDDPALTGFLAGLIAAINSSHCNLRLHPNFSETTLNLRGEMRGRLFPMMLICQFFGFLLAASVRKIWWSALKQKFTIKGVC